MIVSLKTKTLEKQLNNIADYSIGFIDGVNDGKHLFLSTLGKATIDVLAKYIDMEARANSQALHHVGA